MFTTLRDVKEPIHCSKRIEQGVPGVVAGFYLSCGLGFTMELQESAHAVAVSLPEIKKNCETMKIKSLDRQHDDQVYQCFIRIKLHEKIFFIFKVSSAS